MLRSGCLSCGKQTAGIVPVSQRRHFSFPCITHLLPFRCSIAGSALGFVLSTQIDVGTLGLLRLRSIEWPSLRQYLATWVFMTHLL